MIWQLSHRADQRARVIADRHYNRQKIGSPQFVPPGRCLVLLIPDVAFWVTSWPFAQYVKHAWAGAWVCSAFRNERPDLYRSSDLIRDAVAATRWRWPDVPDFGMITFVDVEKTRRKRDPGRCYRKAGFHRPTRAVQTPPRHVPQAGSLRCNFSPRRCRQRSHRSKGHHEQDPTATTHPATRVVPG